MSSKPHNCCAGACCVGLAGVFLFITLGISLVSLPSFHAVPEQCIVTNVTYPIEIPKSPNDTQYDHFHKCDCGKNCLADLGYCIKIYVKLDNLVALAHNEPSQFNHDKCTFYEYYCEKGESLSDRINALTEAYNIATPYINMINTNETINCYSYNGNVFINRNLNNLIITISVTGGLFIVMCICAGLSYCIGEKREEND